MRFVSCSAFARLLAIALRNEADDRGVFVWEPLELKMRLLPADNVDVASLLDELLTHNQVRKFTDESSKEYGVIRNFRRFQRPEKPKVVYPLPNDLEWYAGQSTKDGAREAPESPTNRRPVGDQSGNLAPEGIGTGGGNWSGRGGARALEAPKKSKLDLALDPLKAAETQAKLEASDGRH